MALYAQEQKPEKIREQMQGQFGMGAGGMEVRRRDWRMLESGRDWQKSSCLVHSHFLGAWAIVSSP